MNEVNEKLAKSLTANSVELIPFLPYLLQDLWELGSSAEEITNLLSEYCNINKNTKVLDLACGKGAVSIKVAKRFKCQVLGVDIMEDFIECANKKAIEHKVDNICKFKAEDITKTVNKIGGYDIVILGAVGDVLGSQEETLVKLIKTIKTGGYIIIDDVYSKDENSNKYITKKQWAKLFNKLNLKLIKDSIATVDDITDTNNEQQKMIRKRAEELKFMHPDKASLFDEYVQSQNEECDELENDIIGVTLLLQRNK